MSQEGLCWECREKIAGKFITTSDVNRDMLIALSELAHCHHEPKEKAKCWCKLPDRYKLDEIIIGGHRVSLKCCPECGGKLE